MIPGTSVTKLKELVASLDHAYALYSGTITLWHVYQRKPFEYMAILNGLTPDSFEVLLNNELDLISKEIHGLLVQIRDQAQLDIEQM